MESPSWIRTLLKQRRVPFQELRLPRALTARELARRGQISPHRVAKVVIVIADGSPVELVLPANRHIVFDSLRSALSVVDVRLATESEIGRYFSDVEVGAVPPLRHWKDIDVVMDESLDVDGEILFQAGTHTDAVRLEFDDWFRTVRPRVRRFSTADSQLGKRSLLAPVVPPLAEPDSPPLRRCLLDLVEILELQAKEIERLGMLMDLHGERLIAPSQMPTVISTLAELRSRLEERPPVAVAN